MPLGLPGVQVQVHFVVGFINTKETEEKEKTNLMILIHNGYRSGNFDRFSHSSMN